VRIAPPTGAARYGTALDHAMRDFERAVVRIDGVDPITTELVRLRCARVHDCRRCSSMRDDAALDSGFDEALGAKIDAHEHSDLEPRHKAALRLADAMILTPGAIEPGLREELRAHFSEAQIAELCLDVVKWSVQKALVALRIEPPPNEGLTRMAANPDGSFTFGEPLPVH
jgi:alkylhydroperoxidase family enzyme